MSVRQELVCVCVCVVGGIEYNVSGSVFMPES